MGNGRRVILNFNVYVRPKGKHEGFALSFDGSEGNYYTLRTIAWSPDSKKLAAYHMRPGYRPRRSTTSNRRRRISYSQRHFTIEYRKPGDALDIA